MLGAASPFLIRGGLIVKIRSVMGFSVWERGNILSCALVRLDGRFFYLWKGRDELKLFGLKGNLIAVGKNLLDLKIKLAGYTVGSSLVGGLND